MQNFLHGNLMIGRLKGILLEKQPPEILLDVQGVGYELLLPMTSFMTYLKLGKKLLYLPILLCVKMLIFFWIRPKNRPHFIP